MNPENFKTKGCISLARSRLDYKQQFVPLWYRSVSAPSNTVSPNESFLLQRDTVYCKEKCRGWQRGEETLRYCVVRVRPPPLRSGVLTCTPTPLRFGDHRACTPVLAYGARVRKCREDPAPAEFFCMFRWQPDRLRECIYHFHLSADIVFIGGTARADVRIFAVSTRSRKGLLKVEMNYPKEWRVLSG
jgi:hypothetical protein